MRPRRFATGTEDLAQACAALKRAYVKVPSGPSGPNDSQPTLDGFAKLLIILGVIWALGTGIELGWHQMLAHAISRPELVQSVPVQPAQPQWQVGQSGPVTLEDGQKLQVTYMGALPFGKVLNSGDMKIGQMWKYGNSTWVWAIPAGGTQPTWIDP